MEFDSLAFSAARSHSAPVTEDSVYCPACQEQCVPDKHSTEPTCPTCGGATTVRFPLQSSGELVDEDLSAGINSGEGVAHTRPRSALETATPPGNLQAQPDDVDDFDGSGQLREPAPPTTQEEGNRTAVGGRVAREVLAFMAAIERGDLSTAVGLPVPPGVTILENLPGLGARRSTSAPALERVVKNLPRVQVEDDSWVLHQTVLVLRAKGKADLDVDAVFAPFSPPPSEPLIGPIVLAVPSTAHENFQNMGDIKGSVLVVDRGVCTFASKALRADAAGAAAAVIVQTHDVWPYVMEDSMGEVKAAGGLKIPVCMVSREKGEAIKKALREATEGQTVRAELSVSSSEKDCIVCQELYAVGSTLVRLPCGHLYHEGCLLKWLKMRNTCPYCRQELPSSNEEVERERTRREGQEGSEAWRGFFN